MFGQVVDPFGQDRDLPSGEPVSPDFVAYDLMTSALRPGAIDIG
jgi:hypothetical protein